MPHVFCHCPEAMWAFPLLFQIPKTSKALDEPHSYIHPCIKFFSHSEFLECIVFLLTFVQISQFRECLSPSSLWGKELDSMSSLPWYLPSITQARSTPQHPRAFCEYYHYYSIQHGVSQLCSARSVLHLAHLLIDSTNIYWVPILCQSLNWYQEPKNRKAESLCWRGF